MNLPFHFSSSMSCFLIALTVLVPVAGGFLVFPLHFQTDRARNLYVEAVTVTNSILVWLVLLGAERKDYTLYSFSGGFSMGFHVDGLGSLFAGMVSLMWPLVLLYAFEYMEHAKHKNSFFAFYTMTYGITAGVAFAANMTTVYVFYEMLTLVTLPLVTHYQDHESMYAGRKYAAYTIGGASAALFPVVMLTVYGNGAHFAWGGCLQEVLASADPAWRRMMLIAFVCGFFGFGVKAAVFPIHGWLPTASAAPTPVTALLHAVAVVNSGVFCVIRMTWYAYGPDFLRGTWAQKICLVDVSFTLLFAAAMALRERHFKRRLAYSTVSNLSYMLFGVMLLTETGLAAGAAHMLFHGIIKITLFMCAGAFMHVTGKNYIFEINGVGKKMPYTFAFYTLGALSLTGIPAFCGFVSKWQLFQAGAQSENPYGLAGVVCLIISAFLCAMYTLTITGRAFFPPDDKDYFKGEGVSDAGWRMLIPIAVFTAANILFGLYPQPILHFLRQIAQGIL